MQRLEADVPALERDGARIERRRLSAGDERHRDVVGEIAAIRHDRVLLDPLDLETTRLVRVDRAVVERQHVQRDAMRAHVVDQVAHEEVQGLATEALAPQRLLADADPDLGAPRFRLPVAIVRLTDRAPVVLDREELAVALGEAVDPLARGSVVLPALRIPSPLEPREVCVVVRHRPERDALAPQCGAARRLRVRHAIASPALGSRCPTKSAGRALLSRSSLTRSRNASSVTPRSSSREPRRRTDTVPAAASLSPTMSM